MLAIAKALGKSPLNSPQSWERPFGSSVFVVPVFACLVVDP
jgi:hypothetical protein